MQTEKVGELFGRKDGLKDRPAVMGGGLVWRLGVSEQSSFTVLFGREMGISSLKYWGRFCLGGFKCLEGRVGMAGWKTRSPFGGGGGLENPLSVGGGRGIWSKAAGHFS